MPYLYRLLYLSAEWELFTEKNTHTSTTVIDSFTFLNLRRQKNWITIPISSSMSYYVLLLLVLPSCNGYSSLSKVQYGQLFVKDNFYTTIFSQTISCALDVNFCRTVYSFRGIEQRKEFVINDINIKVWNLKTLTIVYNDNRK